MRTPLADVPRGLVEVDLHEGTAVVQLDASLYPLPAIYAAAYVLIDRCYVLLDRPADGRVCVTLMSRDPAPTPEALRALVGELANELLACAFRHQLAEDNRVLVETVTLQAMAGAMGPPSLADLADFDFTDDALDDPLGIAQSWEEKHGRGLESAARRPDPAGANPGTDPDADPAEAEADPEAAP
jgi:His-Xaa-Ser system protein HxsD